MLSQSDLGRHIAVGNLEMNCASGRTTAGHGGVGGDINHVDDCTIDCLRLRLAALGAVDPGGDDHAGLRAEVLGRLHSAVDDSRRVQAAG